MKTKGLTFMEAVEAIKQNMIVKRSGKEVIQYWDKCHRMISCDVQGYDRKRFNEARFSLEDFEATDWEIYEEKKTLWDKPVTIKEGIKFDVINGDVIELGGCIFFKEKDIKEHIKIFLKYLKPYFISNGRHINEIQQWNIVYDKAKEIFGEEFFKD